jgi:putative endonuclease
MGNPRANFFTHADADGKPQQSSLTLQNPCLYIEIPADIGKLKRADPQLALEWRLAVREAMQQAFVQGYSIVDFMPLSGRWAYVLAAPVPWFMYVIECRDGSLYTGIALDIERRLKQHNAGKGAAYTAARRPVILRAAWRFTDQGSALKAEAAFKKKSREQKLSVLNTKQPLYGGLPVDSK